MQKKPTPQNHKSHPKPKKKKLGLFYKIHFSVALIISLVLAYFLIVVSTEPKSIPYVAKKIEENLQSKFGNEVTLGQAYVSFTRYGTLNISIRSLKVVYTLPDNPNKQAFIIPRLEVELSLLDCLLMRFQPSKIKIIDPTIFIDDLQKFKQSAAAKDGSPGDVSLIINILSSIKNGTFPIKNFELENAKLVVKGLKFDTEILVKKSQIRTSVKNETLNFSSMNKVSFDPEKNDVDFNSNCQLSKQEGLKCDLALENFVVNSISELHPSLYNLNKVGATLNATASFVIKDGEINNIVFKAAAAKGDFEFLEFFGQKLSFANFSVIGEYNHKMGILNLSEIKTDFENVIKQENIVSKPHLEMSLLISDLKNPLSKKLDFYIKLQDVQNNEMEKYWPAALRQNGIRNWVISHIKDGVVKSAYARFSMTHNEKESELNDMDSQVIFSGFNLQYDEAFPTITNLSGIASFNMKGMKVAVSEGDVLNSKITGATVAIEDFNAPVSMLKIIGKSAGKAADSLKHIDYKSSFATDVEKYLNGDSQNEFNIVIPLQDKIELRDVYISVGSAITKLDNGYLKGDVSVTSKKDFKSNNFITSANLTGAEINAKEVDITKKAGVEGGLDLVVFVPNSKKVEIKNISLWKKELQESKVAKAVPKKIISKLSGDIIFGISPFSLNSFNFKNSNFGKNNYDISYDSSNQKLSIKGQQINLATLLEQKTMQKTTQKTTTGPSSNFKISQIQITANNLLLRRNKSLKNFYLFLGCKDNFCSKAVAKGSYGQQQILSLNATKKPKDEFVTIEGRVSDIGYLAEAFDISNIVSGGDATIKLTSKMLDKKQVFEGEIEVDSDITIYENQAVKKLATNDLFSQVKDKIFSNDKTTFDSVKVNFSLQNGVLNIKSLIANNYKIGITAKGTINLKNNVYNIKGMIVPGFIINNLFGIGKIPILGNVINGLLTGGEGGGVFGIRYEYVRKKGDKEATFETNKVSSFVPTTIKNLFDLI